MEYIVYKKFKGKALYGGEVELSEGTCCNCSNNMIIYNYNSVCLASSQNGHDHFTRNDDGQGLLRGQLITDIIKVLTNRDNYYQDRWNKLWEDNYCHKYRRPEHVDFWLWNDDFYNASIEDLKYISNLIDIKGE